MLETEKHLQSLFEAGSLPHALLLAASDNDVVLAAAKKLAGFILHIANLEAHPDYVYVDSASVEDMRRILGVLSLAAFGSRVIIVNRAEDLTPQAVSSLLKKIEEPAQKNYFLLLTEHESKLMPTLRSRLMTFRFDSLPDRKFSEKAREFLSAKNLAERLNLAKEVDPREEDLRLFLKDIYEQEMQNLSQSSGLRLSAILRVFELLAANVSANRALAWLSVQWQN